MARKKKTKDLFSGVDQERQAIDFLRERGYGVFKVGGFTDREEIETVKRLQSIGYKVEHARDSLVKVDPRQISSTDDIVVYFYEMMRRHSRVYFSRDKLTDKNARTVDRSVVNRLVNWRVEDGDVSLHEALAESFIMIDTLFEKAPEWGVDIKGIGILSPNHNKAFLLSLLNEVRLKQDAGLRFQVDRLVAESDRMSYLSLLEKFRDEMYSVEEPTSSKRRKIKP